MWLVRLLMRNMRPCALGWPVIAVGQGLGIGQLVQGKENPLEGVVFLRQGEVIGGTTSGCP